MKIPTASRKTLEEKLHSYSSRIFETLAVKGRTGQSDYTSPSVCEDNNTEVYSMHHFWQIDDVQRDELDPAVKRLHDYLKDQGWKINKFIRPPKDTWSELSAENPKDGYQIVSMTIADQNRIGVEVYSPCVKVPPGESNPAF